MKKGRGDYRTIVYRNRDDSEHEISIRCKSDKSLGYGYEDFETDNLYELILRTSLFEKIFSTYSHQVVAVTNEALSLPLEDQPWFFGNISEADVLAFASGTDLDENFKSCEKY